MNKLMENILTYMRREAYSPMTIDELINEFEIKKKEIGVFYGAVDDLEREGLVYKTKKDKYGLPDRMSLVIGVLQGHSKGYGFVIPIEAGNEDIYVSAENMNGAMNSDTVVVRISSNIAPGKKLKARL